MLKVKACESGFDSMLVGGTMDLNAGQIIDRVGVHMGLPFPAGAHLERLALENTKQIPKKKPKISDLKVNLSGLENMAVKLYSETDDKALTSAFVLEYIGDALCLLANAFSEKYGDMPFVFSGGVMSNSLIKAGAFFNLNENGSKLTFSKISKFIA